MIDPDKVPATVDEAIDMLVANTNIFDQMLKAMDVAREIAMEHKVKPADPIGLPVVSEGFTDVGSGI